MSMQNENLFVKLVKKSVGLPTAKSDCCGSSGASSCCGAESSQLSSGGGDCCGVETSEKSEKKEEKVESETEA